jgi:transcription elongation factor GreA
MSDDTAEYLTQEKFEELSKELEHLKTVRRKEVAENLEYAKSLGDLSENADYHVAKEDQAFLEGKVLELQEMVRSAVIIQEHNGAETVQVGVRVTVQEEGSDPETFFMVGAKEASPREGKISNESPVGRALLGKRVGETAAVSTPAGETKFKIVRIE